MLQYGTQNAKLGEKETRNLLHISGNPYTVHDSDVTT